MMDSRNQLSALTVVLHCVIAAAIIGMIIFGLSVEGMKPSNQKWQLLALHASIGTVVLAFGAWRLVRRFKIGFFEELEELGPDHPLQRKLAYAAHISLLLATVLMPIAGIVGNVASAHPFEVFGGTVIPQILAQENKALEDIAGPAHVLLADALTLVIAMHILRAFSHQLFSRDGTLTRMLGMKIS